jgi:DNA repair exonuclease SbcCD ATPase subunit
VLGGLLSGKTNSKAETSLKVERSSKAESPDPKDELAFGDNEPVQRVGFESEIESQQKLLEGDPPSLETLEPPPGVATPIELNAIPQQAPQPLSSEELREQIRRLEQQLKDLEAVLEADPK